MGGALLKGWLEDGIADPRAITVIEPDAGAARMIEPLGVSVLGRAEEIRGPAPSVVLFAVKPQVMDEAVPAYSRFAGGETLFLSIAAGRTSAYFEGRLGHGPARAVPVIRAMPNTPAQVRRGITVLYATVAVSKNQMDLAQRLMEAVGEVVWLADEGLMDAVTAVSGSGPAYIFYLIECLADAGRAAGLGGDVADQLARATVAGSAELARQSELSAAELRSQVTSPGGTTAAALEVLMGKDGLRDLLVKAVAAASERSRELAG
jgi:pyrroline-5-carboxylate reductase